MPATYEYLIAHPSQAEPIKPYNDDTLGEVYIIHFCKPWYTSDGRVLEHYVGFSKKVSKRLAHHRRGTGANFLREAIQRGIEFRLVVRFAGTKRDERRLKVTGHIKKYCPCCNPDKPWKFKPNVLPHEYSYAFVDL
jgi:predicted GIY-YIG superfamily endonuclease